MDPAKDFEFSFSFEVAEEQHHIAKEEQIAEGQPEIEEDEYEDTAGTQPAPEADRIDEDHPQIPAPPHAQGNIVIQLGSSRDVINEEHQYQQSLEKGDDNYNYPVVRRDVLPLEEVTGGTSKKAVKKTSRPADGTAKSKAPGAPSTRRKRRRSEDPATYVPLALREKKQDEYYWYEF